MKLPGVVHDSVVHQKKRVKKNGKWHWTKPNFVKVKCGTQLIDRCWKFIKERLSKGTHVRAGMSSLQAQIRSAQYEYWYRGDDMWVRAGELLSTYMPDIVTLASLTLPRQDISCEKRFAALLPHACFIPFFNIEIRICVSFNLTILP